jgi:hypothetical protein
MGSLLVIVVDPGIQVGLQFVHGEIKLLAESDLIKLL